MTHADGYRGEPPSWVDADDGPGSGRVADGQAGRNASLRALPKVRAFAAGAAFVAEWSQVRSPQAAGLGFGTNTLNLEFAPAGAGDAGQPSTARRYDWSDKLVLQLTPQEMVLFAATVYGWQASLDLRFHGDAHDRGLEARPNKNGGLLLRAKATGRQLMVPLEAPERVALSLLCTKVLKANHPDLETLAVLAVMRNTLALREGASTAAA